MISREVCQRVLHKAVSTGADYAEIFAENTNNHTISMIDSKVDGVKDTVVAGAAVRVYKGLRSVMASTIDTSEAGLIRCAEKAAEALDQGSACIDIVLRERLFGDIHPIVTVPSSVGNARKVEILKAGYFAAKDYDECIRQVSGALMDVDHNILVANSDGLYTQDRQIRTRIMVQAVADKGEGSQAGMCAPGRRMGLEMFDTIDPKGVGIEAARQAAVMAGAGYCPAGTMPVAIAKGVGGVIFHEACGHSLEAAAVAYGQSQFTMDKLGTQIAGPKVTAIDDGTMRGTWGSINIDDEGTPSTRNVLIENGVLKNYMIDKFNGRRMGMAPTGASRRQSFAHTPTSRMTNTFIAPGPDTDEEIIASMEYGLYAASMAGGSVTPVTGDFNFSVSEGYIVRNGKICEPVRGASLVGNGAQVIKDIDMVSSNLDLAEGMCGASSGMVPTSVGQPMIRVSGITVGGR